ncbi:MAG: hypothetical protein GX600_07280 [Dehalococcoidia bacterium]|nr:hypothetical protein [Dehalococcoidia bacterium]
MVYDPSTGQVILFGGQYLNDTWAYDSAVNAWSDLQPTGDLPAPRVEHSMIFDSATGLVILFGRADPNTRLNDTWGDLQPTGGAPSACVGHAMVYEPATGSVILFGGMHPSGSFSGETWGIRRFPASRA